MGAFSIPRLSPVEREAFNKYFNEGSIVLMRMTIIVIVTASLGYFYLDYLSAPVHYKTFWALRAFAIASYLFAYYLTYKKEFIVENFQLVANTVNLIYNFVILLMIYLSTPEEKSFYYYFIGLIVIWITTIPMRIRLKQFLFNAFVIGWAYVFVAVFRQHLLEGDNVSIFINNMFFFLSSFLAVAIADIVLEIFIRRSFLGEQVLEIQNAELEQKNAEITSQNEEIMNQKQVLEKRHKQIIESIHYAQTIQGAILPPDEILRDIAGDYFLIYLPKHHVSGDFYYATRRGKYKIIAVGDCTGHGVPGGFLAMLSITKIDNIVYNCSDLSEPSMILEKLRVQIKKSLWATRDGLDLALCTIDTETNRLYYSGAYNHLIIMRDQQLHILKAVRTPVGKYPKELPFETRVFDLQPGDLVYMFSDGLATQRSKDNIPYGSRRLRERVQFLSILPLQEQKNFWMDEINEWTDTVGQLDDITILAFRA